MNYYFKIAKKGREIKILQLTLLLKLNNFLKYTKYIIQCILYQEKIFLWSEIAYDHIAVSFSYSSFKDALTISTTHSEAEKKVLNLCDQDDILTLDEVIDSL